LRALAQALIRRANGMKTIGFVFAAVIGNLRASDIRSTSKAG
jgi:hypothetical protein